MKVAPSRSPPADVIRSDPFIKPVPHSSQPAETAGDSPATDLPQPRPAKASTSSQLQPTTGSSSVQPVQRQLGSAFDTSRKDTPTSSDSESDSLSSDRPPLDILPEEGELSGDMDTNLSEHDQSLSEE